MTTASKSMLLLVLVCAVWMDRSGVVIAQGEEGTTVAAAAADSTADANAHGPTGTGPMSEGETTPPAEGTHPSNVPHSTEAPAAMTTPAPTQPQTTMPSTTMSTTAATTPTTMTPSTASSTMATSTARPGTPAAHNQVAENTTTAAPVTTTPKPSSASVGAVLSVATLVFGLCLVHM